MPGDEKPLDPQAAATIAKVRRLMMIAIAATFVAIAVVLVIIGYRVSQVEESAPSFAKVTEALPAGAKVLSTAVSDNHIVVTVEVGGVIELHTFDPDTLKPQGRLRLEQRP